MGSIMGNYGQGSFAICNTDPSYPSWMDHERTHVWQSRAMGSLFYGSYLFNSVSSWQSTGEFYPGTNHWENQASNYPF